MLQFSKYFKYFLLIIIFVIPVAVLADDLPVFKNCTVSPSGEIPAWEEVIISGSVYDDCASGGLLVVDIIWGDGGQNNWTWTCTTSMPIEEDFLNQAGEPYPVFKHQYTTPGEYEISLYASDSNPDSAEYASWSKTITVGLAQEPITITATVDPFVRKVEELVPITVKAEIKSSNYTDIESIFIKCPYPYNEPEQEKEDCVGTQTACEKSFQRAFLRDGDHPCQAWVSVKNTSGNTEESRKFNFFVRVNPKTGGGGGGGGGKIGVIEVTNPLSATDFKDFIDKLVRFLFTICLIVVPILLVVAGIMFVTSQGDPEKARKARKMILFTLIGFAIISLARILVSFIEQIFK